MPSAKSTVGADEAQSLSTVKIESDEAFISSFRHSSLLCTVEYALHFFLRGGKLFHVLAQQLFFLGFKLFVLLLGCVGEALGFFVRQRYLPLHRDRILPRQTHRRWHCTQRAECGAGGMKDSRRN